MKRVHEIKKMQNYAYDENDIKFERNSSIISLAALCMLSSMICGATGVAGGMVLGPLFLKLGMIP